MIIDTHVHFGSMMNFSMKKKTVLMAMEKYKISKAIVSNCQSVECDFNQNLLPEEVQVPMLSSAKAAIDFAKDNPGKIYAAIWIKPHLEIPGAKLEYYLKVNLEYIKAIKVHAFHSAVSMDDARMEPYLQLAKLLDLPIIVHTAGDPCSACQNVYRAAKKYPEIRFILAHLGLGTDNEEAIDLCSKVENLYGDTAWVPMEKTVKFIKKCGSHKLMFGSDMPIDGLDTYTKNRQGQPSMYLPYFDKLQELLTSEEYENLMWKNAKDFYNL